MLTTIHSTCLKLLSQLTTNNKKQGSIFFHYFCLLWFYCTEAACFSKYFPITVITSGTSAYRGVVKGAFPTFGLFRGKSLQALLFISNCTASLSSSASADPTGFIVKSVTDLMPIDPLHLTLRLLGDQPDGSDPPNTQQLDTRTPDSSQ